MSFDPIYTIDRWDGGANTRDLPENLAPNQSLNPRNIDFIGTTFGKAPGFTRLGAAESETVPGFALYNHRVLSSDEVLLKSVNNKLKFHDEVSGAAELLTDATFTAGKKWWFASFNSYLYGGNGVENFVRWRGGSWSTLASPVTSASTTVVLAAGTGARYAATGSGMIEGDTFAWTGVSTDTLTGVSGLSSNHAAGARVIEKLDSTTYSGNPKGSVGLFCRNRLFVRDDANPNLWYFSKLADNTSPHDDLANFTIAGSGSGDAGYIILPAPVIDGIVYIDGSNNSVQVVFCADGTSYAISVTDSGGATVGIYTPFKVLGNDLAGLGMVAATENDLVIVDNLGTVRSIGYAETNTLLRTARLSDHIEPTMTEIDFSGGRLKYFARRLFCLGRQNGAGSNNFTLVKDTNPDAFAFYDHWNFNDLVEWKNDFYGLSSLNGDIYKLFDGMSAEGNAISASYPTGEIHFGAPSAYKELRSLRFNGYITENCQFFVDVYFENEIVPQTFLIAGNNTAIVDPVSGVAVGTVLFGRGIFGGSGVGVKFKEFFAEMEINNSPAFRKLRVVLRNDQDSADFRPGTLTFTGELKPMDYFPAERMLASQ